MDELGIMDIPRGSGFAVLAQGDGVQIIGISRGVVSKLQHTERLEPGEAMIGEFTGTVSAIKVRGPARVYTPWGEFETK